MTRNDYLEMVRQVSMIPMGIHGREVPEGLWVTWQGMTFYPLEYTVRAHNGELYQVAVLHDLRASSIAGADLRQVEPYKPEMLEEEKDGRPYRK